MAEAYIYDAVRTPRGKGKPDGALHDITPLSLSTQILAALRDRNGVDTRHIDDVILGVVSPVADQGADIARTAVLMADYAQSVSGMQINRFCASGLDACNIAAGKIAMGEADLVVAGGVESMSRVAMGLDGGAWSVDPSASLKSFFTPQGIGADLIATLFLF